jgi:hypothetical protein
MQRSLKCGYLTVGDTVCTCITFCIQRDMFPLPPVLGEESQVLRVKNQCIRVWSMYVNVRKHPGVCGKSLNVYVVYRMHVISQNSRRKAGEEDISFLGPSR